MQKRAPVSTMSWILSLALLPFVGFVIDYSRVGKRSHACCVMRLKKPLRSCDRLPICALPPM